MVFHMAGGGGGGGGSVSEIKTVKTHISRPLIISELSLYITKLF